MAEECSNPLVKLVRRVDFRPGELKGKKRGEKTRKRGDESPESDNGSQDIDIDGET